MIDWTYCIAGLGSFQFLYRFWRSTKGRLARLLDCDKNCVHQKGADTEKKRGLFPTTEFRTTVQASKLLGLDFFKRRSS